MIAHIHRAWVDWKDETRFNVIARDARTGEKAMGYCSLRSLEGQSLATLCKSAAEPWRMPKPRVALTLRPPNAEGWSVIEGIEIIDAQKPAPKVEWTA